MDKPYKSKIFYDARIERKKFLSHLRKLKIAHQKQLDTVKHIVIDIADQIVTKKIVGFQQAINKEIGKIFDYIQYLKGKLNHQFENNLRIAKVIENYEQIAIWDVIKQGGNAQAIDIYIKKPHQYK